MKTLLFSFFLFSGLVVAQTNPNPNQTQTQQKKSFWDNLGDAIVTAQQNAINREKQEQSQQRTLSAIANGSYADLDETEVYNLFLNSNIRKHLGIQTREFNFEIFKIAAKKFKIPMSQMAILNSTNNEELLNQLSKAFQNADNPLLCSECYYIPYRYKITN